MGLGNGLLLSSVYSVEVAAADRRGAVVMVSFDIILSQKLDIQSVILNVFYQVELTFRCLGLITIAMLGYIPPPDLLVSPLSGLSSTGGPSPTSSPPSPSSPSSTASSSRSPPSSRARRLAKNNQHDAPIAQALEGSEEQPLVVVAPERRDSLLRMVGRR